MKRLIFIFLFVLISTLTAQDISTKDFIVEGKKIIKQGYYHFDKETMLKGRALFERALNKEPGNKWALYYLAYSDYRLATYFMQRKEETDNYNKYIDAAINEAEKLDELFPQFAEGKALMCSILGIKISGNWAMAPVLGPKSQKYIGEALFLEPDNPRVILQSGISDYNTPEFFGGNKEEAIKSFGKAVRKFETGNSGDELSPDWGYADACAWLGIAYTGKEKFNEAAEIYEAALRKEPDFGWIKYNLLPSLKEKLSSK